MQEREFFNRDGVYVSLTRFVTNGQTYAMSGVTAVRGAELKPSHIGDILLGLAGAFLMILGLMGSAFLFCLGAVMLIFAIVRGATKYSEYSVQLSSASGEVHALKSRDKAFILQVVQALNDCIIARG